MAPSLFTLGTTGHVDPVPTTAIGILERVLADEVVAEFPVQEEEVNAFPVQEEEVVALPKRAPVIGPIMVTPAHDGPPIVIVSATAEAEISKLRLEVKIPPATFPHCIVASLVFIAFAPAIEYSSST